MSTIPISLMRAWTSRGGFTASASFSLPITRILLACGYGARLVELAHFSWCNRPPLKARSGATIKGSSICGLYRPGLCVGQLAKLAFSGSPRKLDVVLPKPAKGEIDRLLGHIDNVSDTAAELIVSAQIVRLCGQVFIDRLPNALKQEFRLGRRVEKAVKSPVSFKTCTLPCSVDSHWITGRTRAE